MEVELELSQDTQTPLVNIALTNTIESTSSSTRNRRKKRKKKKRLLYKTPIKRVSMKATTASQ